MIDLNNSITIEKTKECEKVKGPIRSILNTVAIFIISQIAIVIPYAIIYYLIVNYANHNPYNISFLFNESYSNLLTLFLTSVSIAICLLYMRFREKRSFRSMGFIKSHAVSEYIKGLVIGLAMFSLLIVILILTNQTKIYIGPSVSPFIIILFFLGYMVQGASEEILCRGMLFTALASKKGVVIGAVISSVLFGAFHFLNPGFTFLAFINIVLVGLVFSFYFIRTDNILGACAMHSIWNFAQGNIYGISVSGTSLSPSILISAFPTNTIINGGSFGAEGGLACTIVLILSLTLIVFIPSKQKEKRTYIA